jgi:hypothetical protein
MTTLEAMACGVPVVIPSGVGIHDEIPDVRGVYRYKRGDYKSLRSAFGLALAERGSVDPLALNKATLPHSVEAWCQSNYDAFYDFLHRRAAPKRLESLDGKCGIYMVAFGTPARASARRGINTIHKYMPGIPVALVSDGKLGPEDILIQQKDADIGGRIAKLRVYDLAPRNWEAVLYLDADVEISKADPRVFFDWLGDGYEFIICKDAHLKERIADFARGNNQREYYQTVAEIGTTEALQINGGVWAFRRCPATKAFFERWLAEWNVYKGRDQGALIRALYADPLRVLWLGNEFNTLITLKGEEYAPGKAGSAGVLHYVGRARRWTGQVPAGKGLTDPEAWAMVDHFMATKRKGGKLG